jgi:protein involved in polysaccharide export with SLBB domain
MRPSKPPSALPLPVPPAWRGSFLMLHLSPLLLAGWLRASAWLRPGRLLVVGFVLAVVVTACDSTPDKRMLQNLNTQGFGNRYSGNAEEENWVAIGDSISITDSYHPSEIRGNVRVDIDGTVLLPEIGTVQVAGRTRSEIEALLMEKYSPYYELIDIKVKITTQGKKYFIFGEINTQGAKPFTGDLTIFEAVTAANPKGDTANLGRVRLIRADPKDPQVLVVNLSEIIESGDSTFNVLVHERDIIYVPPTMLAQFGYFLQALLFPVRIVMMSVFNSFFYFTRWQYYQNQGFF